LTLTSFHNAIVDNILANLPKDYHPFIYLVWSPVDASISFFHLLSHKSKVVTRGRSTNSFSSVWMELLCMDHEPVMSCCMFRGIFECQRVAT
jgi:hypothetical protein